MANISEADVMFTAHGCLKELEQFIKTTNKFVYGLGNNGGGLDRKLDEPNSGELIAYGTGRWAYKNNLENWFENFSEELEEKADNEKMQPAIIAFNALRLAIKENHGSIEFNYNDIEPGFEYLVWCKGSIRLQEDGKFKIEDFEECNYNFTPRNIFCLGFAECEEDAKEYYGL